MIAVVTDDATGLNGDPVTAVQRYAPTGDLLHTQHPDAAATGGYAASYYGHDDMGSITDTFQGDGTHAAQDTYDAFGARDTTALVSGLVQTGFGYTSAREEPTLGQLALRARDYTPTTGRLTSTDPLPRNPEDGYLNPYTYADNQPTLLADPTGLRPCYLSPKCVAAKAKKAAISAGEAIVNMTQDPQQAKKDIGAGATHAIASTAIQIAEVYAPGVKPYLDGYSTHIYKRVGANPGSLAFCIGEAAPWLIPGPNGVVAATKLGTRLLNLEKVVKSADEFVVLASASRRVVVTSSTATATAGRPATLGSPRAGRTTRSCTRSRTLRPIRRSRGSSKPVERARHSRAEEHQSDTPLKVHRTGSRSGSSLNPEARASSRGSRSHDHDTDS